MAPFQEPTDLHAIQALLKQLGLDEREILVYLSLLSVGIAPTSKIAKQANQQRSNTYSVLRSLKEKGLVTEIERGKILHFAVEPPEQLIAYATEKESGLRQTKQLLEMSLPFLHSFGKPLANKPRIMITTGFEGMKEAYREAVHQEFLAAFDVEQTLDAFGTTILDYFFGAYARKLRGRELVVGNEAGERYIVERRSANVQKRSLPPAIAFQGNILICGNVVMLFAYDDDKTVVRIENASIADMLRAWYEALWSLAGKDRQP